MSEIKNLGLEIGLLKQRIINIENELKDFPDILGLLEKVETILLANVFGISEPKGKIINQEEAKKNMDSIMNTYYIGNAYGDGWGSVGLVCKAISKEEALNSFLIHNGKTATDYMIKIEDIKELEDNQVIELGYYE